MRELACSRPLGMGTRVPFDERFVIESMSDSNIYCAYKAISHLLQGDLVGSIPGWLGIHCDDITHDFWSYIYFGSDYKSGKVPMEKMNKLR